MTETTDPTQPRVAFRCCSELEAKGTEFHGETAQNRRQVLGTDLVLEIYSLIVRTTLEVGRVSVIGPFNFFRMASSYEAIVVTEYFGCMNTIL